MKELNVDATSRRVPHRPPADRIAVAQASPPAVSVDGGRDACATYSLLLLMALAALSPGCSRPAPAAAPAAPAWNWDAYPLESQLLLAQLPASVVAIRAEIIRAPAAGLIRLLPAARQPGTLAAGTPWAEIAPEAVPAEDQQLAQDRQDLAERRARYRRYDLPTDLDKLDEAIATARETLALARFAGRSPELFQGDTPLLDPRLKPAITADQAAARLDAMEDRRRRVAAGDPSADPPDLSALAAALDARQRARDARLVRRVIVAPLAGRLRLALSPEADGTRVETGDVLGSIEDDTALEVVIRGALPLLHAVPAADLSCTVADAGGTEATAAFSAWGIEASGAGAAPVMRFRLPPGAFSEQRGDLAGVELPALVFVRLAEPARIVPKLALATWDADGALSAGWRPGLLRLVPGSRLLAEGRAAVAIVP